MSYPAAATSSSSRNRRRRHDERLDRSFRHALLDDDPGASPRGQVELSHFDHQGLDRREKNRYHPPLLHSGNDLPVAPGLVVQYSSQDARHRRPTHHHAQVGIHAGSLPVSSLANVNPAQDLAIPCTSHGCLCIQCVRTQEVGLVEHCGAFAEIVGPGLHFLPWPLASVSHRLSLRVQQIDMTCEVNTADKLFLQLSLSVFFRVSVLHAYEATYSLKDPLETMKSLVVDTLRSTVPTMEIDCLFSSQTDITHAVFQKVYQPLREFGYELCAVLVTHLAPNQMVRAAMNDAPAATREKQAALHQADAIFVQRIKQAEAVAERSYLQGIGVARQRGVLAQSLRDSTQEWMDDVYLQSPTHKQVMELLLMTQYFDVLMDLKADQLIVPLR